MNRLGDKRAPQPYGHRPGKPHRPSSTVPRPPRACTPRDASPVALTEVVAAMEGHGEAEKHANFPKTIKLNGIDIPLALWKELEGMGTQSLKSRALNLRDTIESTGSKFFDHYRHLVLRPHAGEDVLCR
eukprot:6038839-Prymnesium_polylepis.1